MSKIKILNLYAGIGGNRKSWPNDEIEVTAVEINPQIAAIYKDLFPMDNVIVGDAHKYLKDHFAEYDFIWSSPPCQSHSGIRKELGVEQKGLKPLYPDMRLYQEILFLKHHYKGKYCVENVISYYEPLIRPQEIANHFLWSNFIIPQIKAKSRETKTTINNLQIRKDMDISKYSLSHRKDQILRNCVEPELSLHIFKMAFKEQQKRLI